MCRLVMKTVLGLTLVISANVVQVANAGIFDIFHRDENCCCYCQQCGRYCEDDDADDDDHHCCCLCPPAPPRAGVGYSFPVTFDFRQPIAQERTADSEGEEKKLEDRMKRLEEDLARLAIDVKALAEAMQKIDPKAINKNK